MDDYDQSKVTAALWGYATAVYASAAVAGNCLRLQDECGLDVNLLLVAAWLASLHRELTAQEAVMLDTHCVFWRERVVQPLREQRRAWRNLAERAADYKAIKALELAAEREQLARIAQCIAAQARGSFCDLGAQPPGGQRQLLAANLAAVLALHPGAGANPLIEDLIEAVLEAGTGAD
ncbi:MAG: hypothetical protein ACI87W_000030 [Halieaceae bacterium]|jgi:uncharacterized protein (TIGR02444 family)